MSGVTGSESMEPAENAGRALKLQTDTPHLVNIGSDRLSTSVTIHPIPPGRVTLGSGPSVDILVHGTGVLPLHCHIENSEGVVTIYPLAENLSIDGVKLNQPTRLSQGAMLTIGRSNYMRFNHPAEAKIMKSVLPNSRISMALMNFEPVDHPQMVVEQQSLPAPKFIKKPPAVPKRSPRESFEESGVEEPVPSSIMTKVSKFEYLAAQQNFRKSISPKVFSSNLVTVNTPAKDVLGKSPPDLQSFTKNLPQNALNYADFNSSEKHHLKTPDRPFFGKKSSSQYVNVTVNETRNINNKVIIFENGCLTNNPSSSSSPSPSNFNLDHNELNNKSSGGSKNINIERTIVTSSPIVYHHRNPQQPPSRDQSPNNNYVMSRSVTPSPVSMTTSTSSLTRSHCEPLQQQQQHQSQTRGSSGSATELSGGGGFETLEDLVQRSHDAEMRRNQAHKERVIEQEIEKVEQARLEEILSMCVEYEKQAQCEKNKITPNRIKTNGSLPRDKRQYPNYGTPPPSPITKETTITTHPHEKPRNNSYENVHFNYNSGSSQDMINRSHSHNAGSYENVQIRTPDSENTSGSYNSRTQKCVSPYENVHLQQQQQHNSTGNTAIMGSPTPRTRIKTFVSTNKEPHTPKETTVDMIENKFAALETEQRLLEKLKQHPTDRDNNSSTKFIFPLEETDLILDTDLNSIQVLQKTSATEKHQHINTLNSNGISSQTPCSNDEDDHHQNQERLKQETLKRRKRELTALISVIKRQIAELEIHEEELHREIDLEHALISGEHKSKMHDKDVLRCRKEKLQKISEQIEESMQQKQLKQEEDQKQCKMKLEAAQQNMVKVEEKLTQTPKTSSLYEQVFEEYLQAQELLDNERKTFEDLEFHHLEEEADWLASREEVQREIMDLSKRIDLVDEQIQDLEQQKLNASRNNPEFKLIKKQQCDYISQLDRAVLELKKIDNELSMLYLMSSHNQESEQEEASSEDSDSDKSKDLDKLMSNLSLNILDMMSCSVFVNSSSGSKTLPTNGKAFNMMSQSFNENLLEEKSVLESGIVRKCPSQDDIDRISKVTSNAPMNIDQQQGSLGRKTIESLKDIERKRHLHLCQQGSQVIEQERQRVLALKQRVQQEVRNKWAQRQQENDTSDLSQSATDDSKEISTELRNNEKSTPSSPNNQNEPVRSSSEGPESPRPMSEISEMSVETGGTLSRKRVKSTSDKQRPLTRYLPIRSSDLDLRQHIESAGHQVVLCPHVLINSSSCRGFLHKKGSKLNSWSKRWFVFDRIKHTFTYYNDKSEKKPKGGAYFQAIEEVYLDHLNNVKSPNPQLTFIVKTHERCYYLMAPSPEAMRIWVDVVFTGAEGYQEFDS